MEYSFDDIIFSTIRFLLVLCECCLNKQTWLEYSLISDKENVYGSASIWWVMIVDLKDSMLSYCEIEKHRCIALSFIFFFEDSLRIFKVEKTSVMMFVGKLTVIHLAGQNLRLCDSFYNSYY